MVQSPGFPFDLETIAAFFKSNDFAKTFPGGKLGGLDPQALFAAQQKNMAALIEAGKSAATGYQQLFASQLKVFEQTLADAQDYVRDADANTKSGDFAAQGEAVKAAFERAMANMASLAEEAHKANSRAYSAMAERVQDSIAELQSLTAKFKA